MSIGTAQILHFTPMTKEVHQEVLVAGNKALQDAKGTHGTVHQCSSCALKFTRKTTLMRHVQSKHKKRTFPCSLCTRTFSRRDVRDRHESEQHAGGNGNGKGGSEKVVCPRCGRHVGRRYLDDHVKRKLCVNLLRSANAPAALKVQDPRGFEIAHFDSMSPYECTNYASSRSDPLLITIQLCGLCSDSTECSQSERRNECSRAQRAAVFRHLGMAYRSISAAMEEISAGAVSTARLWDIFAAILILAGVEERLHNFRSTNIHLAAYASLQKSLEDKLFRQYRNFDLLSQRLDECIARCLGLSLNIRLRQFDWGMQVAVQLVGRHAPPGNKSDTDEVVPFSFARGPWMLVSEHKTQRWSGRLYATGEAFKHQWSLGRTVSIETYLESSRLCHIRHLMSSQRKEPPLPSTSVAFCGARRLHRHSGASIDSSDANLGDNHRHERLASPHFNYANLIHMISEGFGHGK